ncbi:hypothetical protein Acr_08g0011430 [Actinidia rufa]|uniref:Uncharacterized protein n=1 Tax=Actinidia rufa TaxID=165716 RepID=A0A7J0F4A6_9ERIC|nr:hypothetical protein Acr_08g0011430 [Actinidia rufa]
MMATKFPFTKIKSLAEVLGGTSSTVPRKSDEDWTPPQQIFWLGPRFPQLHHQNPDLSSLSAMASHSSFTLATSSTAYCSRAQALASCCSSSPASFWKRIPRFQRRSLTLLKGCLFPCFPATEEVAHEHSTSPGLGAFFLALGAVAASFTLEVSAASCPQYNGTKPQKTVLPRKHLMMQFINLIGLAIFPNPFFITYYRSLISSMWSEQVSCLKDGDVVNWGLNTGSSDHKKLRLACSYVYDMPTVGRWIIVATRSNVKELDLTYCPSQAFFELPYCLVNSNSLRVLKLNLYLRACQLPCSVGFSRLTPLDLVLVE